MAKKVLGPVLTFYEVIWSDSETDSGWSGKEDVKAPDKLCKSYGFFIKQNDTYFTIASDYDPGNNHFNRFMHIPLVNIKSKRRIKL